MGRPKGEPTERVYVFSADKMTAYDLTGIPPGTPFAHVLRKLLTKKPTRRS